MSETIRIVAKMKEGMARVKILIRHPMETGMRKDKATGTVIPAHFIKNITLKHNDKIVMTSNFGVAVSKNPYIGCRVKGVAVGDSIKVHWLDSKGKMDSLQAKVTG